MDTEEIVEANPFLARVRNSFIGRNFFDKKFLRYTALGIVISLINIFLLWLFIDVVGLGTVLAGFIVTGIIFILRYVLLIIFKIF